MRDAGEAALKQMRAASAPASELYLSAANSVTLSIPFRRQKFA
jgi:hypothetical protein